jgi:hypothetical protein
MRWVGEAKSISPIDDRGPDACGSSMATPYSYSGPVRRETLWLGTSMASGNGQLCETPAAQALRAALSSQPAGTRAQ